jgi:hypothetical protein
MYGLRWDSLRKSSYWQGARRHRYSSVSKAGTCQTDFASWALLSGYARRTLDKLRDALKAPEISTPDRHHSGDRCPPKESREQVMPNYISTALYFEDRAKRARHQKERERLLAVARKYRDLATHEGVVSESPKVQPPTETRRAIT